MTAADLSDEDWVSAVLAEVSRTSSGGLYLLLRRDDVPVQQVVLSPAESISAASLLAAVGPQARDVVDRAPDATDSAPAGLTVVICTRGRPAGLRLCLQALVGQTDPDFDVLVVDNTDGGSPEVQELVDSFTASLRIRLAHQPLPGLSNARNAALLAVSTELVAWIDDDEEADTTWVVNLKRAFRNDPQAACVVGEMLPARLATTTDLMFEQFGGYNKRPHRQRETYTKAALGARIFYPLPSFGTGGNMAMRTSVFTTVPWFDADLGAGTRCPASEDTLMFSELLDAGYVMAYEPSVVTWHHHRESVEALQDQLDGYGRGLGAYYAALVLRRPRRLLALASLLPKAVFDIASPTSLRNSGSSPELSQVRQGNRLAILRGALTYSRVHLGRRLRRRSARPA